MGRKKNKKLSVKKETLRKLDSAQLGQAAGGTKALQYEPNYVLNNQLNFTATDPYLPGGGSIRPPRTGTCTCTEGGFYP